MYAVDISKILEFAGALYFCILYSTEYREEGTGVPYRNTVSLVKNLHPQLAALTVVINNFLLPPVLFIYMYSNRRKKPCI
jgi:hypothetical protein